jgi:hypothetical protein
VRQQVCGFLRKARFSQPGGLRVAQRDFHHLEGRAGMAQVVTPVVQKNPSVMVWLPLSSVDKTSN